MATRQDRRDGPRPGLTRERVLHEAIDLADEVGISALSMRKLAQRLDVEAMSLYHHVRDKTDLLDGMLDVIVRDFERPATGGDWRSAIRASAISAHDALVAHPWAPGLMTTATAGPTRLGYMDALLGRLRAAGFSAELTHHAYHALDSHIVGFTLWQAGFASLPMDLGDLATTFLQTLDREAYPWLAEHVEQHSGPPTDADVSEFEFGLDVLLEGLERRRRQRA
jgi:AcrR family transcriptional regulator